MAAPVLVNPNVAQRADQTWWVAPIALGAAIPSPVFLSDLPTSDPHVAGQLYNATGVVTQSQG